MQTRSLDTRDLEARRQALEDLKEALEAARAEEKELGAAFLQAEEDWEAGGTEEEARIHEAAAAAYDEAVVTREDCELEFGDDEAAELIALESLKDELGSEWNAGVVLISEHEFEDHARDDAEGMYSVDWNAWPFSCIDWKQAAEELQMDYSTAELAGATYFYQG